MEIVRTIAFSDIPGWNPVALEFVRNSAFRSARFPTNDLMVENPRQWIERPYDWEQWEKVLSAIGKSLEPLSLTPEQEEAMAKLQDTQKVRFVITGQQPGILSGPLYTVLKIWTAIVRAEQLQREFPQYHILPLFWIEDNDSDWLEAASVWSYDEEFSVHKIEMEWEDHPENAPLEIARFGMHAKNVLREFYHCLPHTEERKEALKVLEPLYQYRTPLVEAFLHEIQWLFRGTPLLFIRGSEIRKHGLMQRILEQELKNPFRMKKLILQYAEWAEQLGMPLQAEPNDLHLFFLQDQNRVRLYVEDRKVRAGNTLYSFEEMETLLRSHPERFTTAALLRPVVQDSVLPTILSVLGPAELAYWAELKEVFSVFDVFMSAVELRYSATFLEPKARRKIRKLPLQYEQFFQRIEDLEASYLETTDWTQYERVYKESLEKITGTVESLKGAATAIDPTLEGTVKKTGAVIAKSLEKLRSKMRKAYKFQQDLHLDHLRKVHCYLYPNMNLQERSITPWYFVARLGSHRLRKALEALKDYPPVQGHMVVDI